MWMISCLHTESVPEAGQREMAYDLTPMDDYQTLVRAEDDEQVLDRLFSLVNVAERVPVLMAELERRGEFDDPKEWSGVLGTVADNARRSKHPALNALADRIPARKSQAVREPCPLCSRFRLREDDTYCDSCRGVLIEAFGVLGSFDASFRRVNGLPPIIRANGPICYLCGIEPTDHAEHVFPIAKGGEHRLSNLGGACWRCNLSKGDRLLDPTDEQVARLADQQVAVRASLDAIDVEVFWNQYLFDFWEDWIADAVEDLSDDYPDVDRDDVHPYIEDASEDDLEEYPFMPRELPERAVDEVLRRIEANQ